MAGSLNEEVQSSDKEHISDEELSKEENMSEEEDESDETDDDDDSYGPVNGTQQKRQNSDDIEMPKSKRPRKSFGSTKMPTAAEMRLYQETDIHYHSTLFRLQMEEMLTNISIKDKYKFRLDSWVNKFETFLKSIPAAAESVNLLDCSKWCEGVQAPMSLPSVQGVFKFSPPTEASFVGSYSSRTVVCTEDTTTADLMVVIPKICLSKKDYRNGTYLVKRVLYLMRVATALVECDLVHQDDIEWTQHLGEPLRPALLVSPKLGSKRRWRVRLLPVPAPGAFTPHAFAPHKVNIKRKGIEECQHLNFLCAVDTAMADHNAAINETFSLLPALQEGVRLVKTWLRQRQLRQGRGCLSGHVLSMLVLFLYRERKIGTQMSAYEVFRTVIVYLGMAKWSVSGPNMYELHLSTNKDEKKDASAVNTVLSTSRFHDLYPVVFVDYTGFLNLAATVQPQVMEQIEREAKLALELLNSNHTNSFEQLFIDRAHFHTAFDQSISIEVSAAALSRFYSPDHARTTCLLLNQLNPHLYGDAATCSDHPVGELHPMVSEICRLLRRGLTNRASLVSPQLQPPYHWPVTQPPPTPSNTLRVGLTLDPTQAWLHLTKDTSGEGDAFRELWGDQSSLRRFQDGSVCETVAWTKGTEGLGDRREIPGKMCRDLLYRHFGIRAEEVHHFGPDVEAILRLPASHKQSKQYSTGEECSAMSVAAYDAMQSAVRSLNIGLPVTHFASSSPVLSNSEVFPLPLTSDEDTYYEQLKKVINADFIDVLVFLERSGKWPRNLEAVNVIRQEFHRTMYYQLKKKRITVKLAESHVLTVVQGFPFRLRITYQGEVLLLRQMAEGQHQIKNDDEESGEMLEDTTESLQLQVRTIIAPSISVALKGLGSTYTSYGGCVRLCRRWLRSQMMEPHMPPLATQLLVAYLYLCPGQFHVPNTPYAGFMRFLELLSKNTDFDNLQIFVNLGNEFSNEDLAELQSRFKSNRESFPEMCIVTPYDIRGDPGKIADEGGIEYMDITQITYRYSLVSECTRSSPTANTLPMMQEFAHRALEHLQQHLLQPNAAKLFQSPTSIMHLDLLIHLDRLYLSRDHEAIPDCNKRVVHKTNTSRTEYVDLKKQTGSFLVDVIKGHFRDDVLILYDQSGGDVIGLSFNPDTAFREKPINEECSVGHQLTSTDPPTQQLDLELVKIFLTQFYKPLVKSVTIIHQ